MEPAGAYHRGEKVVDLWGVIRNKQTGEPWEQDTIVHSATKGLPALTLAIAHSRGWLDYEERIAKYWPEFGRQNKERITVRHFVCLRQKWAMEAQTPLSSDLSFDIIASNCF